MERNQCQHQHRQNIPSWKMSRSSTRPETGHDTTPSLFERHDGLNNSDFKGALRDSTYFTRTTIGNRMLTYVLTVIQHPEGAKTYGSGANNSPDRRIVDPGPTIKFLIFEYRDGIQIDITFSYEASFFLFATLEAAPFRTTSTYQASTSQVSHDFPVLQGTPVSCGHYLDRFEPAIYFMFPELLVRHEGKYRLCFNLYEMMIQSEDRDRTGHELSLKSATDIHPEEAIAFCNEFIWRMEIKSSIFTVWSPKIFSGLAETTTLSRIHARQFMRGNIVTKRRTYGKKESAFGKSNFEESVLEESDFEPDKCAPPWKNPAYASQKHSMSSTGTSKNRLSSQAFDANFPSASNLSSDKLNLRHMGEIEAPRSQREELTYNARSKTPRHYTLSEPSIITPSQRSPNRLLATGERQSQDH